MTKPVYIWYTETHDFEFVSETLEAGEREFAKRYSNFAVDDKETSSYSYTDNDGELMLVWAIKVEFIQEEEE